MLILIFLILVGAGFTFLSMQNTQLVSLNFLNYSFSNLPINYVIIGSILLGVILAFFISFINSISTAMKIRGQHQQLKQEKKSVAELTKKVHQLELENVGLKIDTDKFSL
ncbi:MAG: LapA family protein [Pseudomonadales bacterium]|nr:LapA family protein [Pseudomonadales bacterium]